MASSWAQYSQCVVAITRPLCLISPTRIGHSRRCRGYPDTDYQDFLTETQETAGRPACSERPGRQSPRTHPTRHRTHGAGVVSVSRQPRITHYEAKRIARNQDWTQINAD